MKDSANATLDKALTDGLVAANTYQDRIDKHQKAFDDLPKTLVALKHQYETESKGKFGPALRESIAAIELVTSDKPQVQIESASAGTGKNRHLGRAANLLGKRSSDAADAGRRSRHLHDAAANAH